MTLRNSSLMATGSSPAKSLSGFMGCVDKWHGFTHFGDELIVSLEDDRSRGLNELDDVFRMGDESVILIIERNNITDNNNC